MRFEAIAGSARTVEDGADRTLEVAEPDVQTGGPQRLIDAHHHLWDLERHVYAWLRAEGDPGTTAWIGDYVSIRRPYLLDDYLRDASGSGLYKSVHVEALWGGSDSVEETLWLQAISDQHGFPHAIVAAVDLCAPDVETQLDRHLASPNLRGVRMAQIGDLVSRRDFRRGFAALAERGLNYDLNIRLEDATHALGLAAAFPGTTILVDNMANPISLDNNYLVRWKTAMRMLARAPNVVMKISGLGMADHLWTVERIRPWVLAAIGIFSPGRCMFGSNWPVDRLYSSYESLVDGFRRITTDLGADERDALFRGTAERCYRI
jgi:predicted TIM-barrel fold metal-dependent hydrolase